MEESVKENLKEFEISSVDYDFILNELLNKKIIYLSKKRKRMPFNKKMVLNQLSNKTFTIPRTLNIGDVTLELIQTCPYSCEGCFREKNYGNLTSISRLEKLVDELYLMGLSKLSLSGGEITSSKNGFERFKHISKYAKSIGVEIISLLTTGFNPKRVEESLNYVDEIQISIDGLKNTHNSYKKFEGAFNRAIRSLKICENSNVSLTTNTVVTQSNLREIPNLIDFLSQFCIDKIRITKIVTDNKNLKPSIENAKLLYQLVKEKQKEYPNLNIVNSYTDCTDVLNCVAGFVYAHIGATGNVFACDYDTKNIAGNINQNSFQDIWTNSTVIKSYRNISDIEYPCLNCNSRVFCFGNCSVENSFIKNGL